MYTSGEIVRLIAAQLRHHRQARGMTVTALAEAVGVSPRLVSEVERGKRPHVSLDTAVRLLQQVEAPMSFASSSPAAAADSARAERAARRRQTWSGSVTSLMDETAPQAPAEAADRLHAVASASLLVGGLRTAYERKRESDVMPRARGRR